MFSQPVLTNYTIGDGYFSIITDIVEFEKPTYTYTITN
jgi:hypothetical protein